MCSVPSMCSRMRPTARVASPRRRSCAERAVLLVRVGEHLVGMGDQTDQLAHRALHLGHLGDQPRRAGALGERDVEADVGAAVLLEVARPPAIRSTSSSRRSKSLGLAPLAGEQRRARSRSRPGGRGPTRPPRREARGSAPESGGSEATNVPPPRPRWATRSPDWVRVVSASRSVEREIRSSVASSRSGGSFAPGASRPSRIAVPSRSTVSSKVVGGRTG